MEKSEVEQVVREYFGNALYSLDVSMLAGIAVVSVEYVDFKPKNTVIKELIDLVPNIDIGRVERNYSDEAMMKEVRRMYGSELNVWVEDRKGRLRKVDFGLYLEERMMNVNFYDKP